MRITFYMLVFISYMSLASPARYIFQFKRVGTNHHPIIYITHPAKVDWTCGEVPWDFKEDNSNKTSVRVPFKNPIRPIPPNKVTLHHL
jgi:hypothetical protein